MSSSRKLLNDVMEYEKNSSRYIPFSSYYVVTISINTNSNSNNDTYTLAKILMKNSLFPKFTESPLLTYASKGCVCMLYNSLEEGEHNHSGNQQLIISEIASTVSLYFNTPVVVTITELLSRTKIITFFYSKVFYNMLNVALEGKPINKDAFVEDAIEGYGRERWAKLRDEEKYGSFYKFINGGAQISILSEKLDFRFIERYKTYFFN